MLMILKIKIEHEKKSFLMTGKQERKLNKVDVQKKNSSCWCLFNGY